MLKNKLIIALIPFILIGCTKSEEENNENVFTNSDIIITEFYSGASVSDNAIELYNKSNVDISLKGYSLNVYKSYDDEPTTTIELDGVINANSTYIICSSTSNSTIIEKSSYISSEYTNNGSFPISLSKGKQIIDTVGTIGYIYKFASKIDLVRKKEYFSSHTVFDDYEWISFPNANLTNLGNIDVPSEETLLEGPKLTEEDLSTPLCDNADTGNGGTLKVSLTGTIDGDTSYFDYGSTYSEYDIYGSRSTRYYGINTPEISHGHGESDPWGDKAKDFTNNMLRNAKSYLVQSINMDSLHETYGRMLMYVWISDKENPSVSEYTLLNYLIIKNGFSNVAFVDASVNQTAMTYLGISYIEYLYDAQRYASKNNLGIHSGKDPDYDYE